MRLFLGNIILFLGIGNLFALPAPTAHFYGGEIIFRNSSSYRVFLEFDVTDNQFGGIENLFFCLDKQDAIATTHYFLVPFSDEDIFDISSIYPKNYFKLIRIYNMESGMLLAEIKPSDNEVFVLLHGNVESFPAFYVFVIKDSLLMGE